jgi:hypothetical protein
LRLPFWLPAADFFGFFGALTGGTFLGSAPKNCQFVRTLFPVILAAAAGRIIFQNFEKNSGLLFVVLRSLGRLQEEGSHGLPPNISSTGIRTTLFE